MEPGSTQGIDGRMAVSADGSVGDAIPDQERLLIDGVGAVAGDPEYSHLVGGDGVTPRHEDLEPELVDPRVVDLALGRATEMPEAHEGDGSVLGTLN